MFDPAFFKGRSVFLTGHTGFKGAWMAHLLANAGSIITGYSLKPPTQPNLFSLIDLENRLTSVIGDIRNTETLASAFDAAQPQIVIHMAAQPLVLESYQDPRTTYETNVMGTVNLLECVRLSDCVKSFLNVTTDKVYENKEWEWGYRENDSLDGHDPYSNSKSCSELVTHGYARSFLSGRGIAISTARAGNVIGGGDFANDRIIPDCIRAVKAKRAVTIRNPLSTRPYQHVLEPVVAYLMIAARQYEDKNLAGCYNVGPDDCDCVTTGQLADLFCAQWGEGASWNSCTTGGPHEANYLKLDCSKIKKAFGWHPRWHIAQAVEKTCEWARAWMSGQDVTGVMGAQIEEYLGQP
jgi:CDP-glucose 4,6-dehydratase